MVAKSLFRSRSRARQRGAAVFIVVLVITMLTAIGIFAASSATLSTTSSGHARQMLQTQYLTQYAINATAAFIHAKGSLDFIQPAAQQAEIAGTSPVCFGSPPPPKKSDCWVFTSRELKSMISDPPIDSTSFGPANLCWDVKVELTDKQPVDVAGSDKSSSGAAGIQYCRVTVNARGAIWPNTPNCDPIDSVISASGSQAFLSTKMIVLCGKN